MANDYFKVLFYLKAILYDAKNDSKYRDVAPLSYRTPHESAWLLAHVSFVFRRARPKGGGWESSYMDVVDRWKLLNGT